MSTGRLEKTKRFSYTFSAVDSQNFLQSTGPPGKIDLKVALRARSQRPVDLGETNLRNFAAGEQSSPRPGVRDGMEQELYELRCGSIGVKE
jgi:hypothetical protein